MGRFDALTQLDKKPLKPTPPPDVPAADPPVPDPLPENEIVRVLAKKQTSKPVKMQADKQVNLQTCERVNR